MHHVPLYVYRHVRLLSGFVDRADRWFKRHPPDHANTLPTTRCDALFSSSNNNPITLLPLLGLVMPPEFLRSEKRSISVGGACGQTETNATISLRDADGAASLII